MSTTAWRTVGPTSNPTGQIRDLPGGRAEAISSNFETTPRTFPSAAKAKEALNMRAFAADLGLSDPWTVQT